MATITLGLFPDWTWIVGAIVGAFIGSFLNVVIYRLPRNLSLANPPKSFCPLCKHSLGVVDLVPLFSWLSTKGKCRYCAAKVPARYFFVELLTAALWGGLWYFYFAARWEPVLGIGFAIVAALLVAVIFIDAELFIIPDEINALLLLAGIALAAIQGTWMTMAIGALTGWGAIWGITLFGRLAFGKDAMGHGDIKLMRGVGAILGAGLTVVSIMLAVVTGLFFSLIFLALATRKPKSPEKESSDEDVPYEPESVGSIFKHGFFYFVCGDVVGIMFPKIYQLIGEEADPETIEDDDWEPSLTTIPFGPYLAIGTLTCLLFFHPLGTFVENKWREVSDPQNLPQKGPAVYRSRKQFHHNGLVSPELSFLTPDLLRKEGPVEGTRLVSTSSQALETLEHHPYVA